MARHILILGASYGSLLATKLLMAGHNVTLVCRRKTADLINREGTEVRIKLRDEPMHRAIFSRDLPGKLDATTPGEVDVSRYDLVGLAMQEPQYGSPGVRGLLDAVARCRVTTFCAPPTVWRMLIQEDLTAWKMSLKELVGAGHTFFEEDCGDDDSVEV